MKAYLIRLTAAAILASLLRKLSPDRGGGRAVSLGAGLLVILVALGPVAELDTLEAAKSLWQAAEPTLTEETLRSRTNALLGTLISQEAEAYILDKARSLGMEIDPKVTVMELEGQCIPWSVTLKGSFSSLERLSLSAYIAEELGIPKERQEWWNM